MERGTEFAAALLSLVVAMGASGQTKSIAERLGYPADAKLLILHADDLGVAHSVDAASFDALDSKAVSSASIMIPTPWVTEVATYAKTHPDADLGLHLTLTSEWKTYRWGSVESADKVPSLLGPDGTFPTDTPVVAAKAIPAEAEREIRAQLERAIALGIHPTHLDSHMGSLFAKPELFATLAKVAHEYHLPFLAVRGMGGGVPLPTNDKDVLLDAVVIAGMNQPRDQWKEFYFGAIRNLKPGLAEMIVHLGHDDAELQAVTEDHEPYGSAWRQRDYDIVTSQAFRQALKDNNVNLVTWRQVQKLLTQ
jgi:predicted glycoside hydrolase/deacetylase ChbG (UPF0249 family)